MRILLIGGSKSGKSTMGQRLTRAFAAGAPMYYWATMEPTDEEDLARIARHLKDREGWGFETIERGRDLLPALERIDPAGAVLFDSITAQLACEMFGETIDKTAPARAGDLGAALIRAVDEKGDEIDRGEIKDKKSHFSSFASSTAAAAPRRALLKTS